MRTATLRTFRFLCYLACLCPALIWSAEPTLNFQKLAELERASFQLQESKVLLGGSPQPGEEKSLDERELAEEDRIEDLGIVAQWKDKGAWTSEEYCHRQYLAEIGTVTLGQQTYQGWRLSGPQEKATKFLATHHIACFRFEERQDYQIYEVKAGLLTLVSNVAKREIKRRDFTPIPAIDVSLISEPRTYVVIPTTQEDPIFQIPRLASEIQGATLLNTSKVELSVLEYKLAGTPFDTILGFPHGPGSHQNQYSCCRRFFLIHHELGGLGIIWQEPESFEVHLSWLGQDFLQHYQTTLKLGRSEKLLAVCMGTKGEIYALGGQSTGRAEFKDRSTKKATLYRFNRTGELEQKRNLMTGKNSLNVTHFGNYPHSLALSGNHLALILSRQMHQSPDGKHHQGAISVIFDASTLDLIKNHGQTSGHSFDNVLSVDSRGNFLALDLGDNFPRGLHLHRFDQNKRHSRVVSTFKTAHSSDNKGGRVKPYPEASLPDQTRYQWSNDNSCYTELGGVLEIELGNVVVFAGEKSPSGQVLDNSRATSRHADPRNLALVVVAKDFHSVPKKKGMQIPPGIIISEGPAETGGYYSFTGKWMPQNHSGIVWLTDYTNKETQNASRVKTVLLADKSIIILWEEWTATSYHNTWALRIPANGKLEAKPIDLGKNLRLGRREDPLAIGQSVYLASGRASDNNLLLHRLVFK